MKDNKPCNTSCKLNNNNNNLNSNNNDHNIFLGFVEWYFLNVPTVR